MQIYVKNFRWKKLLIEKKDPLCQKIGTRGKSYNWLYIISLKLE